jgi:two-component system, OmpR family, response regulator VanR
MQTILAIDDDPAQVKIIEMSLREANYEPITATNGEEGLKAFRLHQPDLVIIDVMMPGMDGWETCYRIRQISTVPIIFLTGRQTTDDKVSGFKLGADDYLIKPFLPDELLARVESVLRRTYRARQPLSKLMRAGPDVIINPASHEVFVHGVLTPLQPAEYTLLVLLAERPGEVASVTAIADALGISTEQPRRDRVKWHIWKLRQAIEDDPKHPKLISTEAGHGYRLERLE